MPLRSRPPSTDGASRLLALLPAPGPGAGGWTPAQGECDDPFWPEPGVEPVDEPALERSWSAVRSAPSVSPYRTASARPAAAQRGAPLPPADVLPVGAQVPPADAHTSGAPVPPAGVHPSGAPASPDVLPSGAPVPPAAELLAAAGPPPAASVPPVASVLAVLRSGRLDPGRHGVFALVAVGVVAAALAGFLLLRGHPSEQLVSVPSVVGAAAASGGPEVTVAVAGKVRRAGLVHLPSGSRVDDALRAAGGALPGVDTGLVNLARKLVDGEQVLVGVAAPVALPGTPTGATTGGSLDLNAAGVGDLDGLPGIGPVLAQKIVDWRTEHGRFASVDQLREVGGIGESKYAAIKAKVHV